MKKSVPKKQNKHTTPASAPHKLTFMGHVRELRRRLAWTVLWFVIVTAAAFPFYKEIIALLMQPLGHEKLYYLTPIGGIGFAMKVCMYVGIIATAPVFIYHLYQFVVPVMRKHSGRQVAAYVALSFLLAVVGIIFTYALSLPSAMHFLTNFDMGNITAMLTVDSYLSFILVYVMAGALVFQIPLIMVIIDRIKPTPPSGWNKYQRHMIVAAFIIAMLITPSPEIMTQVMLAAPVIIMYQIGIGLVWLRHRTQPQETAIATKEVAEVTDLEPEIVERVTAVESIKPQTPKKPYTVVPGRIDGITRYTPKVSTKRTVHVPERTLPENPQPPSRGSIDGMLPTRD